MIIFDDIRLEKWRPDFSSSGQRSPDWTKLVYRDWIICNSIEHTDWSGNPVQVILCDQCGHEGCGHGNYVHVSRLGEHIIWARPQIEIADDYDANMYGMPHYLKDFGSILIP